MSQQINLYNPVFLKQKHYFSAMTMVQALAVVLAGAAGIYAFEVRQNRTLYGVLVEAEEQETSQRAQTLPFGKEFSAQGAKRALAEEPTRGRRRLQQRTELPGQNTT